MWAAHHKKNGMGALKGKVLDGFRFAPKTAWPDSVPISLY